MIRSRSVLMTVASLTIAGVLVLTVGWGEGGRMPARAQGVTDVVPLSDISFPYQGYGMVAILDDGTIIIQVGGEVVFEQNNAEEEAVRVTPSEVIAYQLDTAGLSLVTHDGDVFLDKNGAQLRARDLSAQEVEIISFWDVDEIDREAARQALFQSTGKMELSTDESAGCLTVEVTETGEGGQWFALQACVESGDLSRTSLDATSPATTIAKGGDDGTIVLFQRDDHPSSTCSVTCAQGSCSITCENKGCSAYCYQDFPHCVCVAKPPKPS